MASVPFRVGTLGPHTVLPIVISCPVVFPESHWQSEVSSLSKVILVLRKARSHRAPNLGWKVAESPGWFNVLQKISVQDVMHEWMHCYDEAASHQLSIAVSFWIIQIVSAEKCSSLMQTLMQICCSTCSVILNVKATQYTCSFNGVYRPHWLHSEVMIVHTRAFQSTDLGCQVTWMSLKLSHSINNGWTVFKQISYTHTRARVCTYTHVCIYTCTYTYHKVCVS